MDMMNGVPTWLTSLAWASIAVAFLSAAFIAFDIFGRGHRQSSAALDVVWPVSALYLGPLAVWLYLRWGRQRAASTTTVTGLAGGAASALAHLVAVPLVIASGVTIAGLDLWVMIIVIAVLATVLLAAFEVVAGKPLAIAAVIGIVTVLAFDVGMLGWMLLLHFSENMPPATTMAFWFLMQLGVVLGTLTALPVVRGFVLRRARQPVTA